MLGHDPSVFPAGVGVALTLEMAGEREGRKMEVPELLNIAMSSALLPLWLASRL